MPWLEKTFAEIAVGRRAHDAAEKALERLLHHAKGNGHGDIDTKLREARKSFDDAREAMRNLLASIVEKDIEVRDIEMGLVDFLGERDGTDVWLCWRRGEPAVAHWHEINKGFQDRKPL